MMQVEGAGVTALTICHSQHPSLCKLPFEQKDYQHNTLEWSF